MLEKCKLKYKFNHDYKVAKDIYDQALKDGLIEIAEDGYVYVKAHAKFKDIFVLSNLLNDGDDAALKYWLDEDSLPIGNTIFNFIK